MPKEVLDRHGALLAVVAGLAGALALELPGLVDPARIHPDLFQILPGILSAHPGSPLHGDLLAGFGARLQPLGFETLYRAAAAWIDPILFSRLLSFVLIPLTGFLFHRLARRFLSPAAALAATILFLALPPHLTRFQGGLPRAFVYPILLLYTDGVLAGIPAAVAGSIVLAALCYPPTVVWAAFSFPLLAAVARRAGVPIGRGMVRAWTLGLAAAGTLLYVRYFAESGADRLFSRAEAFGMAEFGAGGRIGVASHLDVIGLLARRLTSFEVAAAGLLILVAGRAVLRIDRRLLALPAAGLIVAAIASAAYPWFYLPLRYVSHAFDLFTPLAVASLLALALARLREIEREVPPRAQAASLADVASGAVGAAMVLPAFRRFAFPAAEPGAFAGALCLALLAALLVTRARGALAPRSLWAWALLVASGLAWNAYAIVARADVAVPVRILAAVRALPADAVIAGSPRAVDPIPVVAHRRVLVSYETAIPLYRDYYGEVKARIGRLLDGYYATSMGEVGRFCRDDGLAALVVDLEDFTQAGLEKGTGFGEPFDTRWRASLAPGRAFALPSFAERHAIASEGSLRLVPCSEIVRAAGPAGSSPSPRS